LNTEYRRVFYFIIQYSSSGVDTYVRFFLSYQQLTGYL